MNMSDKILKLSADFEDILNTTSDLVLYFNEKKEIVYCNKSAFEKLGYTSEQLYSLNWENLLDPEKLNSWNEIISFINSGSIIDKTDTIFLDYEGTRIYLVGNIQQIKLENKKYYKTFLKDISKQKHAEKLQIVYNNISNLVFNSKDLEQLYAEIHEELGKIIETKNFYISIYDDANKQVYFPYYVNEKFEKPDDLIIPRPLKKGLTEYVIKQKHSISLNEEMINHLVETGEIELIPPYPKVWMGALLKIGDKIIGTVSSMSYTNKSMFTVKHLSMLNFVSGQIALAIDRRKMLDENQSQSARLKAIFNNSSHLMWTTNKNISLTSFNDNYYHAIYELWGRYPELNPDPKKPKIKFASDEHHAFWNKKYENAFKGIPQHFETELTNTKGEKIFREMFLNPIYDEKGQIVEVSGIGHNITEKKLAEIRLKESEEKFRGIFESLLDVYYRTNENGDIILVSPSIEQVLGYTIEEAKKIKASDLYQNPNDRIKFIEQVKKDGKVVNFKTRFKKKNGKFIDVLINSKAIKNEKGEIEAIEGISKDISDIVAAENKLKEAKNLAENSLKVKEQFLANMSHEIRTPLNGVIGMVELLSDTYLDKQQEQFLDNIKKSSTTLLNLVNDVLDLSKIEAGKMPVNSELINLETLFKKVYNSFKFLAQQKGIVFEYEIAPDVPLKIISDEKRIQQILSNLLSNAFKFTQKGFVSFKVTLEKSTKKEIKLRFEIKDTGIGIPSSYENRLFNSFIQIDNSFSKQYAGTGLGLMISKELVKLFKGEIGYDSEINKGSTFWFSLSVKPEIIQQNPVLTVNENDFIISSKNADYKILVVDDNRINLDIACKLLEKANFKVESATNGKEALEKAQNSKYSLILMDIQMPEMDGITCTNLIKNNTLNKNTPVIAITAYAMEDDKFRFLSAGLDDYLPKPFNSNMLISKVNEWLFDTKSETEIKPLVNETEFYNLETINQLKKFGGNELVASSFEEYETETEQLINDLKNNLEQNNVKNLLTILHTIKGTSLTLGIEKIGRLAAEMEQNLKMNNIGYCFEKLPILQTDFEKYKNYYKNYLRNG
jgi:PAS domain S-box-containing protein